MSPYIRPSDIRFFVFILLAFPLLGLSPVIARHLSEMYVEAKTAQLREENSPEWQTRTRGELARMNKAISLEVEDCFRVRKLPLSGDYVPINHHQHVYEHNQLVARFVEVQMRSLGGSQYRGVEATFPQMIRDCSLA